MNPMLINVALTSSNYSGPGKLLLTEKYAFFFRPSILSNRRPSILAHSVGGIAALASDLVDALERHDVVPEHLRDPDLRDVSRKQLDSLLRTSFVAKIPLVSQTPVRRHAHRFSFTTAEGSIDATSFWFGRRIASHLMRAGTPMSRS